MQTGYKNKSYQALFNAYIAAYTDKSQQLCQEELSKSGINCTGHRVALSSKCEQYCVTFTADVGIRKLKSDLFLQAIITAFLKTKGGNCKLLT